jgi:hypothetical protein
MLHFQTFCGIQFAGIIKNSGIEIAPALDEKLKKKSSQNVQNTFGQNL